MRSTLSCRSKIHTQVSGRLSANSLGQQSPAFLAPGAGFMEDDFPMDWGCGGGEAEMEWGWFKDDSSTVHLLCFYF